LKGQWSKGRYYQMTSKNERLKFRNKAGRKIIKKTYGEGAKLS